MGSNCGSHLRKSINWLSKHIYIYIFKYTHDSCHSYLSIFIMWRVHTWWYPPNHLKPKKSNVTGWWKNLGWETLVSTTVSNDFPHKIPPSIFRISMNIHSSCIKADAFFHTYLSAYALSFSAHAVITMKSNGARMGSTSWNPHLVGTTRVSNGAIFPTPSDL